jgi:hypothetical protein
MSRQLRMPRALRSAFFTGAGLLAYAVPMRLPAQPPAQPSVAAVQFTAGPTYTASDDETEPRFPNVDVVFQLRGRDGAPIAAQPGDLKLFTQGQEIGIAAAIRPFERTGYGITTILAMDASGTMRGATQAAIRASVARFLDRARKRDQVAVVTLAEQTQIDVPFGASTADLAGRLEKIQPRGRSTRLYDGLLDALALFSRNQPRRRQLLVISDGHDEGSRHTLLEVVLAAKSLGVVIDAIDAIDSTSSIGPANGRGESLATLQQIAFQTGGVFMLAQSGQPLDALVGQEVAAAYATPVAAFTLTHVPAEGGLLSTQLRWKPGGATAMAFVQTPKNGFVSGLVSNIWIWALGGCFLAGVILLLLSLRGSSLEERPEPTAAFSGPPAQPPMPDSTVSRWKPVVRTPTLVEGGPRLAGHATPAASEFKQGYQHSRPHSQQRGQVESDIEQRKTQFAAFFEVPSGGPFARLRVKNNGLAGQSFPVTAATFTVGALIGNHLVLPGDTAISGYHARLYWENSSLLLEDANSTNGTYLNRVRLATGRYPLRPGDEIGLGLTFLIVERA